MRRSDYRVRELEAVGFPYYAAQKWVYYKWMTFKTFPTRRLAREWIAKRQRRKR